MIKRTSLTAALLAVSSLAAFSTSAVAATPDAAWGLQSLAAPTHFVPGDEDGSFYEVFLTNQGAEATDQTITITDTLPPGLGVEDVKLFTSRLPFTDLNSLSEVCKTQPVGASLTVTCEVKEGLPGGIEPAKLNPSEQIQVKIQVAVPDGNDVVELTNLVEVEGGGAEPLSAESHNAIDPECEAVRECAPLGLQEFQSAPTGPDGKLLTAAGARPYQYTNSFALNLNPAPPGSTLPFVPAGGDPKEVEVRLPPGLIANPTASARCTAQQFNTTHHATVGALNFYPNECPDGAAVGVALVEQVEGRGELSVRAPIYSLVPPHGMPAQFGLQPTFGVPVYIDTEVRQGPEGISVRAFARNITEAKRLTAAHVTFWGAPADPSHDPVRGFCLNGGGSCPAKDAEAKDVALKPSFRLPTSCANPLLTTIDLSTWTQPTGRTSASFEQPAPVDCSEPDFSPTIESKPSTSVADSPSGLQFKLKLPQKANEVELEGIGEADLRDATVRLPRGVTLNPSAANGRAACSPAQIGLQSGVGVTPIAFDEEPISCPDASKVGKVEVDTPLLDDPIGGAAYLAQQEANPFGSLFALYIVLDDPRNGIMIKVAGKMTPDPLSGQLTTVFADNPQVPFEELRFAFPAGPRAPLRTPPSCGTYATTTEMVPWTAPEGASASPSDSFAIGSGPAGPCPTGALEPQLSAGLANPTAATYSPFSLRLTRADGTGEFVNLSVSPPRGFTAKLAGIPYCPEAAIAQAAARSNPGQGALEANLPSCPAASEVGTTSAGAGAGPTPFYTGGKVYLAGPYKGAPLSFVAIVPAVAGPFDLGVVVVRIASYVDPETAQVRAQSDPLPTILFGIPLDLRDIRANFDRPNFTLAPTSCEPKSIEATVQGTSGATASASNRFQVGGCNALRFKPKLSLKLNGGTKRSDNPALKAVLTYPKGANYANTARVSVALPHSAFLDQAHIRTICTRVQFAADACPKGSIYGKARATSPLLDKPLEGPVYLRSSSNPLPDVVAALRGQIDFDAVGRIDSHNGGIRTTFDAVPDAPISKVVFQLQGGKKGLLVNSRDICKHTNRATARFKAHNGKSYDFRPVLKDDCKGGGKSAKK